MQPKTPRLERVAPPWWDDRPTFLVGGGDSLKGADLTNLRQHGRVVLLNSAARFAPGDLIFSADSNWIFQKGKDIIESFQGTEDTHLVVHRHDEDTLGPSKTPYRFIQKLFQDGMSTDPRAISTGGNTGFAALNLCLLKRAKLVYLLGYDMAPGGHRHWHDDYLREGRRYNEDYYSGWANNIANQAKSLRSIRIINLNPRSHVRCFEFGDPSHFGLTRPTAEAVETSGSNPRE